MPPATVYQSGVPDTPSRTLLANAVEEAAGTRAGLAAGSGPFGAIGFGATLFAGAGLGGEGFFAVPFDFGAAFFAGLVATLAGFFACFVTTFPGFLAVFGATFFVARLAAVFFGFVAAAGRDTDRFGAAFFVLLCFAAMIVTSAPAVSPTATCTTTAKPTASREPRLASRRSRGTSTAR